jgi:hypothetical protein|tara:strand:- start:1565 stop:1747 length:183 start_codon:yes stop_codon:yes gene_type:complete
MDEPTEDSTNSNDLTVDEVKALINCMDITIKQASDSMSAAFKLGTIRKKLEDIAQPGGPD